MTRTRMTPALRIARLITTALMAVFAIAGVLTLIMTIAVLLGADPDLISAYHELAMPVTEKTGLSLTRASIFVAILGVAASILAYPFFGALRAIIDSVADGSAYSGANAGRLRRMGWLLAGQLVIDAIMAPFTVFGGDKIYILAVQVLAVFILMVLATVVKEGAEMREELEGTV